MTRLWNKDLLLSANTDAFNQRMNEMRYNAASENRKQWANAIGSIASSLGEIGKAAYEDYQRDQRYKSIDDADAEYKNDPVWIAAKNEYAKTGDSSKLNAVKTQFIAQEQAAANMALAQAERDKKLAAAKATLTGLANQIEGPDLATKDKLALITQYNTRAAENGLPGYSKETDMKAADNGEGGELQALDADGNIDYLDADGNIDHLVATSETEPLTTSKIQNIINSEVDQTNDGEFTTADIDVLIGRVNGEIANETDKTPMLAKLNDAKEKLEKQENEKRITTLKNEKARLINEKPTDTSYNNLVGVKSWNEKAKAFNKTLGEHANAVGLITLLKVPQKPEEQAKASWDDVCTWLKNKFPKQIKQYKGVYNDAKENGESDDKAFVKALKVFIDENWGDIKIKYNKTHQSKPYKGNAMEVK